MVKVIHLVSSLSIGSGLMSVIMNYYRHIDTQFIQFGFIYFKEVEGDTYKEEIRRLGGECFFISRPRLSRGYIKYINDFFGSLNFEYQILHIHEQYLTFIFAKAAKQHGVKKIVGHAHTTKFSDRPLANVRNRTLCLIGNRYCDYMMACSIEAGRAYFGRKILGNHFCVLPNAIELSRYQFSENIRFKKRAELGFAESDYIIGNIGRLAPQKNQLFLLDVFTALFEFNNNARLVIIGEGDLAPQLEAKVNGNNIGEYVTFLSKRNDVNELYSAFDAFVLPSLFEGLGIVLIEAQANGLPCFASSVIPAEANVLENYYPISLKESPVKWADVINRCGERIESPTQELVEKGFDINCSATELLNRYIMMLED